MRRTLTLLLISLMILAAGTTAYADSRSAGVYYVVSEKCSIVIECPTGGRFYVDDVPYSETSRVEVNRSSDTVIVFVVPQGQRISSITCSLPSESYTVSGNRLVLHRSVDDLRIRVRTESTVIPDDDDEDGGQSTADAVAAGVLPVTGIRVYQKSAMVYERPIYQGKVIYTDALWKRNAEGVWSATDKNGQLIKGGFAAVHNPYSSLGDKVEWFYFDRDGNMVTGWIKTNDGWYYAREISDGDLGAIMRGWIRDEQDGQDYYLSPKSGLMVSGWYQIDRYWYYFTTEEEATRGVWEQSVTLSGVRKWICSVMGARSFGSLYKDTVTPGGFKVDKNGRMIK